MPKQLAIIVFTGLVIWLWRNDARTRPPCSKATWIPLIWLLLLGSHPISWWVYFFTGIGSGGGSNLEGNPINLMFYSLLIAAAVVVVARRGVGLGELMRQNWGLTLFLCYLGLTVLWAEFPVATTKRWVKEIGSIPVLLVLLTEERPLEAVKTTFARVAFVLFSYSVLVIKYIPELGRDYSSHSGMAQITGIAAQKNSLGEVVAVCGVLLVWELATREGKRAGPFLRAPGIQLWATLAIGLWLLFECDSKTSMISLAFGSALVLIARARINRRVVVFVCLVAVPLFFLLESVFNISAPLLQMLGRNPTLTNRTEIWAAVRENPVDPFFGSGFLNYWDKYSINLSGQEIRLKTAHNGYLETYLDGGVVGLVFLAGMLLHVGAQRAKAYITGSPGASVAFAVFCMTLLANVSESLYARRTPLWSCFILFALMGNFVQPEEQSGDAPALALNDDLDSQPEIVVPCVPKIS